MFSQWNLLGSLARLFFYRRTFLILGLLILGLNYLPSYFVNSYLSDITGTTVKSDFSLLELFRGNICFKYLKIYSPAEYSSAEALSINDMKVNLDLLSFFKKEKCISSISANSVIVNSIYSINGSNLNDIRRNMASYFYYKGNASDNKKSYKIGELFIRNITLKTYFHSKTPVISKIPNIYCKDLSTNGGITKTVIAALGGSITQDVATHEDRGSWVSQGWAYFITGVNTTLNLTEAGLSITNDVLKTAGDIGEALN
ncbi:MAG: hypothetical protein K9M56_06305 [Victivallales bacterium]|nr:hypothetical protein [Victivallales bacterium]